MRPTFYRNGWGLIPKRVQMVRFVVPMDSLTRIPIRPLRSRVVGPQNRLRKFALSMAVFRDGFPGGIAMTPYERAILEALIAEAEQRLTIYLEYRRRLESAPIGTVNEPAPIHRAMRRRTSEGRCPAADRGPIRCGVAPFPRRAYCYGLSMTAEQYKRIEELMARVEDITLEQPLATPQGRLIKLAVSELLVKVVAERIRAEEREASARRNSS